MRNVSTRRSVSSLAYTCYAGGGRLDDAWGEAGSAYAVSEGAQDRRVVPFCRDALADFLLPGLDGVVFVAWGGADGMVYIGYYLIREEDGDAGEGGIHALVSSASPGSQRIGLRTVLALPLRAPRCALPIDESQEARGSEGPRRVEDGAQDVSCLVPGGVSPVRRVVYGGGPKALLLAASDTAVAVFSLESLMYEMVDHLESAVGFLGNGLERDGRYRVCEHEVASSGEMVAAVGWTGRGDGVLVSTVEVPLSGDETERVGSPTPRAHLRMWAVQEGGMKIVWSAETVGVQRVVQGGVSLYSPCVTATGKDGLASVWWCDSGGDRAGDSACGVRREELKHPAIVKDVEWSAGVLRKEGTAGQLQDEHQVEDHPAIMTVDAEGCVRIWVEMMVMMSESSCDCYFAMNLVIPPQHNMGATVTGQLGLSETKAMWVKPVDHAFQRHLHHMSTHQRILWLIVSRGKTLSLYALRGLAPVVVSSALTSPGRSAHTGSPARTSVDAKSPLRGQTSDQPRKPQLLLWGEYAWDGLVGGATTRLSARMLHGEDFPIVDCIETCMDEGGNFLLTSGVSLVTTLQQEVSRGLQPSIGVQQGIHLKRAWSGFGRLRGYEIVAGLVMRRFVALLDASGCLDVWRLAGIGAAEGPRHKGRDALTYYGSLPLDHWLQERSELWDVSMTEVKATPVGYDSIILVAGGGRRVIQVAVATSSEQMDIGVVNAWRLQNTGVVHVMRDRKDATSFSVTCVRDSGGRILCDTYGGFGRVSEDERDQDDDENAQLVPTSSAMLPVTLEDAEMIVHVQDAEQRHAVMIGTSAGRIFLVHKTEIWGTYSGAGSDPLGAGLNQDAAQSRLYPAAQVSKEDIESFSIDRFRSLEYDPVHGLLAAVRASDDSTVALYKIVGGEKWHVVSCGEIKCRPGIITAKWMTEEVLPCICIADREGRVKMFALDNTTIDSWSTIAAFQGGQERTSAHLSYANSCLVCTSGQSAGVVGLNVQDENGRVQKLGKVLLDASGPLPLYHPNVLRALVLSGHLDAFFDVLAALKQWLEAIDADATESLECCSRESSDLMSPCAEQVRARAMPHMFPGVPMDNFVLHREQDVLQALEKLKSIFRERSNSSNKDDGDPGVKGGAQGRDQAAAAVPGDNGASAVAHGTASIESGMLDMSAFGMDTLPRAPPEPAPAPAPVPSFESGMLDMAAFGMNMPSSEPAMPGSQPPPPSQAACAHESGILDMSAFGMDMPTTDPGTGPTFAPMAPQTSSYETGILDMGAFGMGMPQMATKPPTDADGLPKPSTLKPKTPCITLESSKKLSVQRCFELSSMLSDLMSRMKSPQAGLTSSGVSPNSTRYIPGLGEEDATRLDAAICSTRDVLAEMLQDVELTTAVFLVSLAWCAADEISLRGTPDDDGGADGDAIVTRKPSFVNAAGVPMDYDTLKQDQSPQSRTSTGLSALLGVGPLVSPEALVWMCLSPQDGYQAIDVVKKIQGEVQGPEETPVKNPNARNSSNAFLAVPQSHSEQGNTWLSLRSTGVAFWQQDKDILISLLEDSAKAKFRQSRDPDSVALLYAAIGKISVLRGLYKTCNRTKEAEFFSRDFSLEQNRVAANKNAFVLLGQHRYAMAATFFILGGKLRDAVEVCLHQLGDLQLAIVLYRTLGEDMDISSILQDALKAYENLTVACFLRHWVSGNLPAAIESLLTMRHASEGVWITNALLQAALVSSGGAPPTGSPLVADPMSKLRTTSTLSSDVLSRNGIPILAIELELIASASARLSLPSPQSSRLAPDGKRRSGRWKNEASNACALTMIEAPVSLIPDLFAEDDFNDRIAGLIARVEELQKLGIEVSTNVVLHRIESIYKSLSYCETITSPATPKSATAGSLSSAFGGLGLGRTHSLDSQSRNSNQTSGFSSLRRTSLDDVQEHQQLAKMISRSKLADNRDANATQIVYPKAVEIFRVDADTLHSVCSCPLLAPDVCGRLIAVSTPKNGILEFATHPDVTMGAHGPDARATDIIIPGPFQETPRYDSPKHQSGMFSKLVSQIFDQTSWMTDPLENQSVMIDGDVGLAVGVHGERLASPRSPMSPNSAHLAGAKTTKSKILVSHPHRQLFLSGCNDSARIKLWQYDGPRPVRLFTPVPHHDLQQLTSMNHDMFSMSSNFAKSQSLASKMSHWGKAVDLCFSGNGERFASIGEGGVVAVWSLSHSFSKYAGTDVDGATCSEWWHTCLKNQGRSVTFVGGSSAVVAAAGQCDAGNVSLWNTSLPERESCIGRFRHHKSPVNKVKTLPGGWLLACADDAGILSLSDVRMLGSDRDAVLWSTKACKGVVRAMETISYEPSSAARQSSFKRHLLFPGTDTAIVTGGDDGIVRLWDVNSGTLLQESERIYASTPKSNRLLSLGAVGGEAKYTVTGLAVCEEGVLASGSDGVVRLYVRC